MKVKYKFETIIIIYISSPILHLLMKSQKLPIRNRRRESLFSRLTTDNETGKCRFFFVLYWYLFLMTIVIFFLISLLNWAWNDDGRFYCLSVRIIYVCQMTNFGNVSVCVCLFELLLKINADVMFFFQVSESVCVCVRVHVSKWYTRIYNIFYCKCVRNSFQVFSFETFSSYTCVSSLYEKHSKINIFMKKKSLPGTTRA